MGTDSLWVPSSGAEVFLAFFLHWLRSPALEVLTWLLHMTKLCQASVLLCMSWFLGKQHFSPPKLDSQM